MLFKYNSYKDDKKKEAFSVQACHLASMTSESPSMIFKVFEAKDFKAIQPDYRVCVWLKTLNLALLGR